MGTGKGWLRGERVQEGCGRGEKCEVRRVPPSIPMYSELQNSRSSSFFSF